MPDTSISIFISYSRRDSNFVDKLEAELQMYNFHTWVDRRKIEDGQPWKRVLQDAIDQCDVFLAVLSPASVTSRQVRMEYSYALRKGKPVIALEYQPCPEVPIDLSNIQTISFSTDNKQGLRDLLVALSPMEPGSSSKPKQTSDANYFLEHARQAQRASQWREAAGFWQALLELVPNNSEAKRCLEQSLHMQGKEASASGEWEQAISAWEALLKLKPDDAQARRQLSLAQHHQSYAQYYIDAQQFVEEQELPHARIALRRLWHYAPYYGDPEGLALKAGITQPLRSPASLEEEEKEKLVRAQKEREASERARRAKEQKEKEEWEARERERRAREQKEKEEREARERERRAREQKEWKEWEAREQERRAREQKEREEREAREQAGKRSPDWFIRYELSTAPFAVWCSFFFLLSGVGTAVGVVTQSRLWVLGAMAITMFLAYVFGYHRIIHRLPERLQHRVKQGSSPRGKNEGSHWIVYAIAPLVIVVICSFITLFFVNYVSSLKYNVQLTTHFLWITRSLWVGRQIKGGLIIGFTLSLIITLWPKPREGFGSALYKALIWSVILGFFCWLIFALLGFLFNWGWGFGGGTELLGVVAGVIGGVGLGSSLVILAKGKPLF